MKGLGHSYNATYYGISGLEEGVIKKIGWI